MRSYLLVTVTMAMAAAAGCTSRKTGENEVGVLVCKVGVGCSDGRGIQGTIYPPGSTNFFAPWIRDFYTFDTKVQNLEMTARTKGGDRATKDDLQFKTSDGNDISMDVTVVWQIDPKKAPMILHEVGKSTAEVKEKLVRPMARTLVRDVLNELTSESVYNADLRYKKAEEATSTLQAALAPYGVVVTQVILHEHRFHPEYEHIIQERKLSEQRAEQMKSETLAAAENAKNALEDARKKVGADIKTAEGELAQAKLTADAQFYSQQQNATAITAEREAHAQGIEKRNAALSGSGGRAMVKLKIAEALTGKQIVLVPGGGGGAGMNVNKLDINQLIQSMVEASAAQK